MNGISDLDEIILNVRDKTSKVYINEAILAYRNGAYRAAIVSTWIAVTFDIIAKIRELAEQGDKEAIKLIDSFENNIKQKQISQLQIFENSLLDYAQNKFEFITSIELKDLERLKEDRNLCAHPAISESGILYQPTAELVKTHIVHSIIYLLQQQPVQGKVAINLIIEDIKKVSFPQDYENTKIWLDSKYLNRAKPVLIKNLINALLKGLLNGEIAKEGKTLQVLNTLKTIASHNLPFYLQEQSEVLKKQANNLSDSQLWHLIELLSLDNTLWSKLDKATQIRLKTILKNTNIKNIELLNRYNLLGKIDIQDFKEVIDDIKIKISSEVEEAIVIYGNVGNYAKALDVGVNKILPYIPYFNLENTKNLLEAIKNNRHDQILYAAGSERVIEAIYDNTISYISETLTDWRMLIEKIYDEKDYITLRKKIKTAEQRMAVHSS